MSRTSWGHRRGAESTTTTAVDGSTTTVPGQVTDTTLAGTPSSGTGSASATTVKSVGGSTSAKKASTPTTARSTTKQTLASGINNVVASATTTIPPANVQPGGTFTYVNASDPATLDANLMTTSAPTDGVIGAAIYDNLMYFNSKTGAITPSTAQSLTSSDGSSWTLKLRPNITFTDGTPCPTSIR